MKNFVFKLLIVFSTLFTLPSIALHNLPSKYTELEYIESNGTQWIDTNFFGTERSGAYLKYQYHKLSASTGGRIFGYRISSSNHYYAYIGTYAGTTESTTQYYVQSGALTSSPSTLPTLDQNIHEFRINTDDSGAIYFDSNLVGNSNGATPFTTSKSIRLFSAYNSSSYSPSTARIYEARIYEKGILRHTFIPAKRDTDNKIGMYDIVSGTFFENAGTGDFIAGPVVPDPCRNLFNSTEATTGYYIGSDGIRVSSSKFMYSDLIPVSPNKTYVLSGSAVTANDDNNRRIHAYNSNGTWIKHLGNILGPDGAYSLQVTTPAEANYIRISVVKTDTDIQLLPANCFMPIQIATTKFVDDEFAAAEAKLAATVQTIESVVSRTISQTGQIQVLQDTKQTRPDESCPANKKCLLVEDEQGIPHWYEIIEP